MTDFWPQRSIGDCLDDEFPGEWGAPPSRGGNATVLRSTDIDDEGHLDPSRGARRTIPAAKLARKSLQTGDILLEGSGGGPGKPVGRVALFQGGDHEAYVCSNFFRTLRPATDVDPIFLAWRLQHFYRQPRIWAYQQQTTGIINLRFRDYAAAELEVPPLPEQTKIAEILDTVDDAIRKTEQIIAKIEQVKQGLLHDLLTRGIDENGELRDPERHPEQFKDSDLGRIPREWEVVSVGSVLADLYRYPTYYGIDYVERGVPEVRGTLIRTDGSVESNRAAYRYIAEDTARRFPRVRLEADDFVMSVRGTLGKVARVPSWLRGAVITANLIKLTLDREQLAPDWAEHLLRGRSFQSALDLRSSATTIKTIQVPEMKAIRFSRPSLAEQMEIARRLDAAQARSELERISCEKLHLLKKGLMEDLLTGRVRVTPLLDEPPA